MNEYRVTITESLRNRVPVKAGSIQEAEEMIADAWRRGEHILEAECSADVHFKARRQARGKGCER